MSKKNIIDLPERLRIWQELLCHPEGTTYDEFCKRCARIKGTSVDYQESSRQDIKLIRDLIKTSGVKLLETGSKKGEKKRFALSSDTDLVMLHQQNKMSQPYRELITLIASSNAFLPKDFLAELSSVYKEMSEIVDEKDEKVKFETDYTLLDSMRFFPAIYRSIGKQGLLVTRHLAHYPDEQFCARLYPELLKQYKSAWYVFGVITDESGERLPGNRIPLAVIDDVAPLPQKDYPFISSGTDYAEYFDDIVGLEYDENCTLEDVHILVRKEIFERIMSNPLHPTQKASTLYKCPNHKCIQIKVRKNKELIRRLLSYGSDIEVMAPEHLRRSMAREFRRCSRRYEK